MRIVTRTALMAMPPGTVYSYYEPHFFRGLLVKDETCAPEGKPIDWFMTSLLDDFDTDSLDQVEKEIEPLERGEDVPLVFGKCFGRDGAFDDDQLYAVWSAADLRGLGDFLLKAAEAAKEP